AGRKLSFHNVAAIGDAENDIVFLERCEAAFAVANALESVKQRCDATTEGDHGRGVRELIDRLIADDLRSVAAIDRRHQIPLGRDAAEAVVSVPAGCRGVLLAGTSGGGKTRFVSGFIERVAAAGYQYCVIDPEGDYGQIDGSILLGDEKAPPSDEAIARAILEDDNPILCLLAVPPEDRPAHARALLSTLAELRVTHGRPHWLVIDEAHHLLPVHSVVESAPEDTGSTLFITTRPELVAQESLSSLDVVLAVGDDPRATIESARKIISSKDPPAEVSRDHVPSGRMIVWRRDDPARAVAIETFRSEAEHVRHLRKYAEGELAEEKSFYFTGPHNKQRLRAQNLMIFAQLAEGVDDETFRYHLKRHDYSRWICDAIGDEDLGEAVKAIETENGGLDEDRRRLAAAVRERYTTPG
ncbi:MAG: HAD hydrolase family protein, partial [Candidatus Eremiobacteraeota bacterium]|nr:HAD hydrolase family protein [Candidatus Eremiobacteraeota bacterium]